MAAPVVRDQILDGKYRVERVIAEGGMGVLVEAVHLALLHRVALKFPLVPAGIDEREARARLLREARAAATLKSQHVCRIFDVCELESGEPYVVMELLEGEDLGARLGQPMAVREAAELVRQACVGVAEAHARGIVHRDLKPENLFVTENHLGRPCVKVLDFGISKVPADRRRSRAGVTTRDTLGSPLYMSPEQMIAASGVDVRADVWSLGVILYELVAGVGPFDAASIPQICVRVMREAPTPLFELRPDVPEAFAALVHRCLERDPAARPNDAEELAGELAPFARGEVPPSRHLRSSTSPSARDALPTGSSVAWGGGKRSRQRASRVAGVVVAAAVIGLGAAAIFREPGALAIGAPAAAPAAAQEPEAPAPSILATSALPVSIAPPAAEPEPAVSSVPEPSAEPNTPPPATAKKPKPQPKPRPLRDYVAPSGPEPEAGDDVTPAPSDVYEPPTATSTSTTLAPRAPSSTSSPSD